MNFHVIRQSKFIWFLIRLSYLIFFSSSSIPSFHMKDDFFFVLFSATSSSVFDTYHTLKNILIMINSTFIFQLSRIIPINIRMSRDRKIYRSGYMYRAYSSWKVRDINLHNFFSFLLCFQSRVAKLIIRNRMILQTHCSVNPAFVDALDTLLSSCLVSYTFLSLLGTLVFRVSVRFW